MKKLLKKIDFEITWYFWSAVYKTEHFIKCPAQRWNLNKRGSYSYYEPCCDKDYNLHWKHEFERGR